MYMSVYVSMLTGVSIKHRWQTVLLVLPGTLGVKEILYTHPLLFYKLVYAAYSILEVTGMNSGNNSQFGSQKLWSPWRGLP